MGLNQLKQWQVRSVISPEASQALADYTPLMRQILYNRGYVTPEKAEGYLNASMPHIINPLGLLGMQLAVDRILQAIDSKESIVVYGDYDVDGVTATALLYEVLQVLGATVREYIPNRFDEGYGLNNDALLDIYNEGDRLVITVDCGIRSLIEADYARQMGLDLIITDHHHPLGEIPQAVAVINPKQVGDTYPDKNLAGVGLAYKLAQALLEVRPVPGVSADDWLDLVALGTVADMASLVDENRVLVRKGIDKIRSQSRQGIVSLAGAAGLDLTKTTAGDIGYKLGPRLNAAGRLESALTAFDLLIQRDVNVTGMLAQELDNQNTERRRQTLEMQSLAEELTILNGEVPLLISAVHSEFNPGVVGLVASKLSETYYRPAMVAYQAEDTTRGSCRSIHEFHITQALDECKDLLVRHGGHAMAAGFTVKNELLAEFLERMQQIAERELGTQELRRVLVADKEVRLEEFRYQDQIWANLQKLEPTGYGNPGPVFVSKNVVVRYPRSLSEGGKHLKFAVIEQGVKWDAIAFNQGDKLDILSMPVDLMFTFERNDYNGRTGFQLNIKDIKPSIQPD